MKYDEQSIQVLKGLEPVRARPGMYTRTDSPLHIIQEIVDNAADEALGGHAARIAVTRQADGSVGVEADGLGAAGGPRHHLAGPGEGDAESDGMGDVVEG